LPEFNRTSDKYLEEFARVLKGKRYFLSGLLLNFYFLAFFIGGPLRNTIGGELPLVIGKFEMLFL
jgi:hypothetical protein